MKQLNLTGLDVQQEVTLPLVITNERLFPCDIDDTIVMHKKADQIPLGQLVNVEDPLNEGEVIPMQVNVPMVRLVLEEQKRGSYIIMWSRGGYQWAVNVLKAVGIFDKVNLVMAKPMVYGDDKEVSEWLKDRVYLGPDVVYKNANKGEFQV